MSQKKIKHPLYFIALIPPENIQKEVEAIKQDLQKEFNVSHALKLKAHITLQIPFRMPENKEPMLHGKLEKFCELNKSFSTELEDFGRFAKNVIFIQVKDHQIYIELHRKLQKLILSFIDLASHEISSSLHPHITLATRDLKRGHFPDIWRYMEHKAYNASFKMQEIQLLKHNSKTWDTCRSFYLKD